MFSAQKNLIVAIDTPDLERALSLTKKLKNHVAAVKLGLEFFTINGSAGVKEVAKQGVDIFLDLKFHDIPNTVAASVREATKLNVKMLTIHASGGLEMMQWAEDAAYETSQKYGYKKPMILGVTVLTSTSQQQFRDIGFDKKIKEQVLNLARLAERAGLPGMVCSPLEICLLRENNINLKLITPGIRFVGDDKGDQKRVMTPKQALELGSDYLVMGRPITSALDINKKIDFFNREVK